MEGTVVSTEPGAVRVGGSVKHVELPPGVRVGDAVIVRGRTVERKETRAASAPETKSWR